MSKLTFEFESEAPYSKEEIEDLQEDLLATVHKFDDDVIASSAKLTLIDPDDAKKQAEEIRARAVSLIADGMVNVLINVADADGDDIRSIQLSTED
jgi:hypothetical protein